MRIICIQKNCVSYARQQIWYHMHAKTAFYMHAKHVRIIYKPTLIFAYQYHECYFLSGVQLIRIFHETELIVLMFDLYDV